MAAASATPVTPPAGAAELHLQRSELFAFGAILPHEAAGLRLGISSPTRALNRRSGRRWSAQQWLALLEPYLQRAGLA